MTHTAIQEQLDGKTVDWMENVSDEQYLVKRKQSKKSHVQDESLLRH